MNGVLFAFPQQAAFGRVVPKEKILEHCKTRSGLRQLLINDIEQINWAYKLAPETLYLAATDQITEIQILEVRLKKRDISIELLRTIDKTIPFPIFFELSFGKEAKTAVIPKRRNESDNNQWVLGEMLESYWQRADSVRQMLPVALDMQKLYEAMLRLLLPLQQRSGESLKDQLERWALIGKKEKEIARLKAKFDHEKQYNRKVEINGKLKQLQAELLLLQKE